MAIGSVVFLLLVLLNLPAAAASRLKLALGSVFLPLFGVVGPARVALDAAALRFLPRSALIAELERLRLENARLQIQTAQGDAAIAENNRLRALYAAPPRGATKLRIAHVVGRDPSTWWRMVQIDVGSREGIHTNQVVMTSEGLVGRISQVQYSFSQVALVGDAECGVAVVVKETRELGVIRPGQTLVGDGSMVEMTALQSGPKMMAGHTLLTSGQGGVFPGGANGAVPIGIPVGRIVDTRSLDNGATTTARVQLSASFNRLEEVWVLEF
jgi:rod shape-determining protein MreC